MRYYWYMYTYVTYIIYIYIYFNTSISLIRTVKFLPKGPCLKARMISRSSYAWPVWLAAGPMTPFWASWANHVIQWPKVHPQTAYLLTGWVTKHSMLHTCLTADPKFVHWNVHPSTEAEGFKVAAIPSSTSRY